MAKVDSTVVKFQGVHRSFEIHFTKSSLFHIKDCPSDIVEYGEFDNRQTELHRIIYLFKIAAKKADDVLQKVRKVILVKFSIASAMIGTPTGARSHSIDTNHVLYKFIPDFSNRIDGYGFSIDYRILQEVTIGEEKMYYELHSQDLTHRRGAVSFYKNEIPIPYSDDSIKSLDQIKASLKEMVLKISDFFSDPEQLAVSLNSGSLNMLNQ